MKLPRPLMAAALALPLSGCIAAAAIPIVAGSGAIVRDGVKGRDDAPAQLAVAPVAEMAVSAQPAETAALAMPASAAIDADYADLRQYALATLADGQPLPSAQLADPTALQPERRDCGGNAPTVLFDLDPEGAKVPLAGAVRVNSALARLLGELRAQGIAIGWITDRTPTEARAVRDRLVAAGLDPAGTDAIYVERYPGETKQARRETIAQTACIIAIAGDERADFDELYDYIIDDENARALEPMLGSGWFLIDNPVHQ